ncbi:MAG: hypothetical protein SGI92_30935 [Bryobacteraceae bacterium]|nr:hypothetical protein [Bryobacteraceae bacterium]
MKCGLHIRTAHSGMSAVPVDRRVCRDIYETYHLNDRHDIELQMRRSPVAAFASHLTVGVPAVLFVNYRVEVAFAGRWFGRAIKNRTFAPAAAYLAEGAVS